MSSSFFQDFLFPLLRIEPFRAKYNIISGNLLRQFHESMSNSSCDSLHAELCRDDSAAFDLKLIAICSILVAGAAGISIPLLGRRKSFLATDGNLFMAAKAFAAGVILATGFVHMLPDGSENLTNSCLPRVPWSKFPFAGFLAMMSALVTLLADFVGTQLYERKREKIRRRGEGASDEHGLNGSVSAVGVLPEERVAVKGGCGGGGGDGKVFGGEESIVGIHAHSRAHGHSHSHEAVACGEHDESRDAHMVEVYEDDLGHGHGHGHSHSFGGDSSSARHVVVSQVLELGIVSHSVLIGLSLGVSHSPCTIRPLIAALSFHQFFEGFALGGCISQAEFKQKSTIIMAFFFALTTPAGIAIGLGVASSYNPASSRALIVEGILDSISSGILIYMALVDLIAADFMSKRMKCNGRLQVVSYIALFMGAAMMSALAIWS